MTLASALNTASTGLRTAQTMSRVTSENVANQAVEGYVRRKAVAVTGNAAQGGPVIDDIRREVDAALARMARLESGKLARSEAIYQSLSNYTAYLGAPGEGVSLAEKYSAFNTNLTTLVNAPSSTAAQSGVVLAAEELAATVRTLSETLAAVRSDVDMEIRYDVSDLNQSLYELAALNKQLTEVGAGTLEAARLGDAADRLVDKVAKILDVRVFSDTDGAIRIYTFGGAALLERTQVQDVTFNAADGTLMAGSQDITPQKAGVRGVEQGSLAGFSELKHEIIPRFQLQLDEYARGLIVAFESTDASLAPGEAGLFTDGGAAFDPANLNNLAARLTVNDAVRQTAGGEVWRIRDGIGAATPADAGDNTQVQAFIDGLQQPLNAAVATGINSSTSVADFAVQVITAQNTERARAQDNVMAARMSAEVINTSRLGFEGVNIDEEMQDLQLIQQSYAANSRVLTVVLSMIDTLLEQF